MNNPLVHTFDAELDLNQEADGVFSLSLSDQWSIYDTPNGGYVMAVISNAMLSCSDKKNTPIVTANYMARCQPGKAVIYVEVMNQSASFTRLMARLVQDNVEKVRAMGTFSSGISKTGPTEYDGGPPELADRASSVKVPVIPQNSLSKKIDLWLDPSCAEWYFGQYRRPMEFKGWIGFKEKRKLDIPAILLFADSFPPPVFVAYGAKAWVPTIELSVNVRKIPDVAVLKGYFKSRFISSGLVEEDGELWDETGELVAISRQYSLYSTPA